MMGLLQSIAKIGLAAPKVAGNILTVGLEKITGKKYARQTTKGLASTTFGKILGTTIVGTGVAAGLAVLPAGSVAAGGRVALRAGKSLAPKSALGKLAFAAAAPPVIAGIIAHPSSIGKTVGAAASFETKAVQVATGQKGVLEAGSEFVKEHPVAAAVGAIGAAGVIGAKLLPAAVGAIGQQRSLEEQKKQTAAFERQAAAAEAGSTGAVMGENNLVATSPSTPETEIISQGRVKTGRKTRFQPRREQISQRVDVRVMAGNKLNKFIKNAVYA